MRKLILTAAVACLVVSSFGGSAVAGRKAKGRTATIQYERPHAVSTGPFNVSVYVQDIEEFKIFKTSRSEDTMSVSVEDASGTSVSGAVYQKGTLVDRFCGSDDAIKLPGGKEVIVEIFAGLCEDGYAPSIVTQGTITATFKDLK